MARVLKVRNRLQKFFTNCADCHRINARCNACRERMVNESKQRSATVLSKNYHAYIRSQDWIDKSNKAKKRAGYRCQLCNAPEGEVTLNTHHRTYERLGNEIPSDLIVLCSDCHKTHHGVIQRNAPR